MPLSEEEQRLLQQLEQALAEEDPSFASTLRGSKLRARNRRQAAVGAGAFLVGVAVLMIGVISTLTVVGVVGFVAMLAGTYFFLVAWKRGVGSEVSEEDREPRAPGPGRASGPRLVRPRGSRGASSGSSGSFMDRMEERWRRRRDDRQ